MARSLPVSQKRPRKHSRVAVSVDPAGALREVTRDIPTRVSNELWGRASARCQFDGCNQALWKSSVTQERVNIAQRAHIYSFAEGGPRGHGGMAREDLNSIENLLLVCHPCHQKIDHHKDGGRYTATLLRSWKQHHEARIELVTGIHPNKRSHVLLYGANVGKHSAPLVELDAMSALFPHRYPAQERPITLGMTNSAWDDRGDEFWRIEAGNLSRQYQQKVAAMLATGDVHHLSVFGLAPQPLLILLGTLLTDINAVDVYPLLREPKQRWGWADVGDDLEFQVTRPPNTTGPAALVISLSATITDDRVTAMMGPACGIWRLTIPKPHNDALCTRSQQSRLRQTLRPLLDTIKAEHGQNSVLHIFPAASVAANIELGRVRMPKADMPWLLYDQVNARGGFIKALHIDDKDGE